MYGDSDDDWEDDEDDWGDGDGTASTSVAEVTVVNSSLSSLATTSSIAARVSDAKADGVPSDLIVDEEKSSMFASTSHARATALGSDDHAPHGPPEYSSSSSITGKTSSLPIPVRSRTLYRTAEECQSLYASWSSDEVIAFLESDVAALIRFVSLDSYIESTTSSLTTAMSSAMSAVSRRHGAKDLAGLMLRLSGFDLSQITHKMYGDRFSFNLSEMLERFPVSGISSSIESESPTMNQFDKSQSSLSSSSSYSSVNLMNSLWSFPTQESFGDRTFECQVCVEDFLLPTQSEVDRISRLLDKWPESESVLLNDLNTCESKVTAVSLGCGHVFCLDCFRDVVLNAHRTRASQSLFCRCPHYQCQSIIPDSLASFLCEWGPSSSSLSDRSIDSPSLSSSKSSRKVKSSVGSAMKKARLEFDSRRKSYLVKMLLIQQPNSFKLCTMTADCSGVFSTLYLKPSLGGSSEMKYALSSDPIRIRECELEINRVVNIEEEDGQTTGQVESSSEVGSDSEIEVDEHGEELDLSGDKAKSSSGGGKGSVLMDVLPLSSKSMSERGSMLSRETSKKTKRSKSARKSGFVSSDRNTTMFTTRVGVYEPLFVECELCKKQCCLLCESEEWHEPCNCYIHLKWQAKCQKECDNAKWIITNTKKCPKCLSRIEKSQGCNHMVCSTCKYEFCWVCMGPWKEHGNHTGGFYKCHKYIDERRRRLQSGEVETTSAASETTGSSSPTKSTKSEELYKFVHFYNRFHNHSQSKEYLLRNLSELDSKVAMAQRSSEVARRMIRDSGIDADFLKEIHTRVARNRRVLQYTYVFGFYLSTKGERKSRKMMKELFEFLQESLEKNTEYLHELSEQSILNMDLSHLRNHASISSAFADKLLTGIRNGLLV